MSFPSTIIIVHPSERRSKCTVEPLRHRNDVEFHTFTHSEPEDLREYVRLGIGGARLDPSRDAACGLLILDGTWRYAERMERTYTDVPVRSLGPWQTAYPRASKLFDDPREGLATIEAIFAAHVELQREVHGLLDAYHWREAFLAANAQLIPPAVLAQLHAKSE